jgi:pimeloyl-ACP methyl ester carboxylesterase
MKAHFLLVHGNWADEWTWSPFARHLAARGYECTLLSNPNRASKDLSGPIAVASTSEYTKNVSDAADRIQLETGDYPVIVGHSLGGVLSMQVAALGKARALILAAPSLPSNMPQPLLSNANIALFLPWLIGALRHRTLSYPFKPTLTGAKCLLRGVPEEIIKIVHKNLQPDSGLILKEFATNSVAAQADLKKIECPTLCIAGLHDDASPPNQVERIAKAIPSAEFRVVESHHFFMIDTFYSEILANCVLKFLKDHLSDAKEDHFLESA